MSLSRRVVVTGGRDFADRDRLFEVLDTLHEEKPFVLLAEGGAPGADQLAHAWALINAVPVLTVPADWERYGKAAGPIRNQRMLNLAQADLLVVFPGGRGTANCVEAARRKSLDIYHVLEGHDTYERGER